MKLKEFYETNTITNCNICSNELDEILIGDKITKICRNRQYLNANSIYAKFHFFIDCMKYTSGKILIYYFINKIQDIEIFYKEFYNLDGDLLDSFIFNSDNIIYFSNEYGINACEENALSLKLEFCHNTILSEKSIEKIKTLYLFR